MPQHYLDGLFAPRSVAVFGASDRPDSVGGRVLRNLLEAGFKGGLYPINPKHESVAGRPCHPDLRVLGRPVDLAVIATPAATVPGIIRDCGENAVPGAAVISGGFSEMGPAGRSLQDKVLEHARLHRVRLIGPNCLGVMRPSIGLNATFSKNTASKGKLALVSQSGALCTAILDWAAARDVGFSTIVSLGNAADLDFGEVLDYLALDPQTRSILIYLEGIHNARRFMSGLRVAARLKPVVVVKAGRHLSSARAATSHTGALVGADDVFDAALRRAGAVRAETIDELFDAAGTLASRWRVAGDRLFVVTNGGGLGVMAADRAAELGVQLPEPSTPTMEQLNALLPEHWSHGNPVDIVGDAGPERYAKAVEACLADKQCDGVLAMLAPQALTEPAEAAQAVIDASAKSAKPLLTCWMGEEQVSAAWQRFAENQVPFFTSPEASVQAFAYLSSYRRSQQLLMQVPGPLQMREASDAEGARLIVEGALTEGRKQLSITESKALLKAFRIPVEQSIETRSPNEALVAAQSLGFPVAMKVSSPDVTHKSDVGGVRLNVTTAQAVRDTYVALMEELKRTLPDARIKGVTVERMHARPNGREVLVGVVRDPVFGPVIIFGSGGVAVEVLRDRAVALPPLNRFIAHELVGQTRVSRLLGAFRNLPPVNSDALEDVLLRVSEMVCELPQLREMDINPLIVDEQGAVAVDARLAVAHESPGMERYAHMAIHPYPGHLISRLQLADGTTIVIRPIRPEDAGIEQAFVRKLSERARYFRFMQVLQELSPEMLVRFTQIDYEREMALIAVIGEGDGEEQIAVARYVIEPGGEICNFALTVADAWQKKGLGSRLLGDLMRVAKSHGVRIITGEVLKDNTPMLALVERLGFSAHIDPDDPNIQRISKEL